MATGMTTQLKDLARSAPGAARGARPLATWKEDLTGMVIAIWPITALFFDARNHNNKTGQESFFSLAHIVLYSGMTAFAVFLGLLLARYQREAGASPFRGIVDLKAIPVGYGVSFIGLLILGVAGPWDLIWHELYGFEVNVEAIVSPPHLALFFGGLLVSSAGIRSMWAKRDLAPDFRAFLPAFISGTLFVAMLNFITMYTSAWMTNVPPSTAFNDDIKHNFHDVVTNQHIGLTEGLRGYGDNLFAYHYYTVSWTIAALTISTLALLGPTLLMLRRWRVPPPTFTLMYLIFGLLMCIQTQYRDPWMLIPLTIGGATVDLLQARLAPGPRERLTLGGIRLIGPLTALTLWSSYFIVYALHFGFGWKTPTWAGAIVIAVMAGFGVAFLVAPPSYGPRLVEGGEDEPVDRAMAVAD
jgi:hypothetical protein